MVITKMRMRAIVYSDWVTPVRRRDRRRGWPIRFSIPLRAGAGPPGDVRGPARHLVHAARRGPRGDRLHRRRGPLPGHGLQPRLVPGGRHEPPGRRHDPRSRRRSGCVPSPGPTCLQSSAPLVAVPTRGPTVRCPGGPQNIAGPRCTRYIIGRQHRHGRNTTMRSRVIVLAFAVLAGADPAWRRRFRQSRIRIRSSGRRSMDAAELRRAPIPEPCAAAQVPQDAFVGTLARSPRVSDCCLTKPRLRAEILASRPGARRVSLWK